MNRVRVARQAALAVTMALLGLAYALSGHGWVVVLVGAMGAITWIAVGRRVAWASGAWLAVVAAFSALATLGGHSPWPPLIAQLAALAAWDLDRFEQRVRWTGADHLVGLSQRHLRQLGLALMGGGFLAGISLLIRAPLGFWPTLLLAAGLLVLLIGTLRRTAT